MKFQMLIILTMMSTLPSDAPKNDAIGDKEKLQGVWKLTSATIDGKDKTAELEKHDYKAIIKDDQVALGAAADVRVSPLVLNPATTPKQLDILVSLGIYELKGDDLKICLGGKKRPTEFASKPGSDNVLFIFKRTKEKPELPRSDYVRLHSATASSPSLV